jgi:FkbM family methyltransferase
MKRPEGLSKDAWSTLLAAAELLADPANASVLRAATRQAVLESMATPKRLEIEGSSARVYVHSRSEDGRARNFEETHTIEWLRAIPDGSVLYDVGANIGVTTLLAAEGATRNVRVVAIEPSPLNFASLVKNVALNGLSDRIYPLAIGLGSRTAVVPLHLTTYEAGAAMHSFGEIVPLDADRVVKAHHHCLCVRFDDLVRWDGLPFPTHVKIDVDGGEADVLEGARHVFSDPRCRAVQVEIVDADDSYARSRSFVEFMASAGLTNVARFPRREPLPAFTDLQFSRP